MTLCHPDDIEQHRKSSGWHTAVSQSHPDEIRPGANSSGWLSVWIALCHPDDIVQHHKSSGWHPALTKSHPDDLLKLRCQGFLTTEALKGHRVVWKIEIYYLIRMTYEWKSMSSGWHNNIVVTHPDEIPISAKSSGWHMVVWYVIRMTYCSVQKSSGWDTARS